MLRRLTTGDAYRLALLSLAIAAMLVAAPALSEMIWPQAAAGRGHRAADAIGMSESSPDGCDERGGTIALRSSGRRFCKIDFPDGGRACTDTNDCLGGCVVSAVRRGHGAGPVIGACRSSTGGDECLTELVNGAAARAASCTLF